MNQKKSRRTKKVLENIQNPPPQITALASLRQLFIFLPILPSLIFTTFLVGRVFLMGSLLVYFFVIYSFLGIIMDYRIMVLIKIFRSM